MNSKAQDTYADEDQQDMRGAKGQLARIHVSHVNGRSYENYLRDAIFTERREVIAETGLERVVITIEGYVPPENKSVTVL